MIMEVVAALIRREDRFLICKRPPHKARGLQWEFVGGKVEPGETGPQALVRECREELDIRITPGRLRAELIHEYPDLTVRLCLYEAQVIQGIPRLLEHVDLRWVTVEEADTMDLCPADIEILELLRKEGI